MKLKITLALVGLLLLSAITLSGEYKSVAPYMKMGVGAKAMGMGGTGTAVVNNVTAGYWNPAGLTKIKLKHFEFTSMYTNFDDNLDKKVYYSSFGMNFAAGSFAVSWINAGDDDFKGYDETGTPTGSFTASDNNISVSYASLYKNFRYGATCKMYLSSYENSDEKGFGLDLGMIWDVNDYMSFGMMGRDIYGDYTSDERIPIQFNIGASIYPIRGLTIASDFRKEEYSDDTEVHFGAEYWTGFGGKAPTRVKSSLFSLKKNKAIEVDQPIQGGLRVGFDDGPFTAGFGIKYKKIETNYSYATEYDNEDITTPDTHRISLVFRF